MKIREFIEDRIKEECFNCNIPYSDKEQLQLVEKICRSLQIKDQTELSEPEMAKVHREIFKALWS